MPKTKKAATKPAGAKASGGAAPSRSVAKSVPPPAVQVPLPTPAATAPGTASGGKAARPSKSARAKTNAGVNTKVHASAHPSPHPRAKSGGKASLDARSATAPPPPAEPAGPKKWPKGGPSKAELRRYREKLVEMRHSLLASSKELASEALKSSGQDFSVDHMADHGSDNYEQDFSLKLLEGESQQLAEIRDALLKIDGRSDVPFGLCEACSDEAQGLCDSCPWIPASRLDVVPHARLCVQTKEIEERRRP